MTDCRILHPFILGGPLIPCRQFSCLKSMPSQLVDFLHLEDAGNTDALARGAVWDAILSKRKSTPGLAILAS